MKRALMLQVRINEHERQQIAHLAAQLDRTEADTVRWLVRQKVRELGINAETQQKVSTEA